MNTRRTNPTPAAAAGGVTAGAPPSPSAGQPSEISMRLSDRAMDVCQALLPAGRRVGNKWLAGDVGNHPGDSLNVELDGPRAGLWYDHASGEGGDLIDLARATLQTDAKGAFRWARSFLGIPDASPKREFHPLRKAFRRSENQPWMHGSRSWPYHDEMGNVVAHVVRFDMPDGSKDVLPLRFLPPDDALPDPLNPSHWRWRGWRIPEPVPLYNAHLLARRAADPVLVVEGEKTADAAAALFPGHVVVTWQGGSKTAARADVSALNGRQVLIWPDNDNPGRDAAKVLAARITGARIVPTPQGLPDGWDLADPAPAGFDPVAWFRNPAQAVTPNPAPAAANADPDSAPATPGKTAAPTGAPGTPTGEPIDLHYDPVSTRWWSRRVDNPDAGFVAIDKDSARKTLIARGFQALKDPSGVCDADRELLRRMHSSGIVHAGPLAGHRPGILDTPSGSVLVSCGPTLPSGGGDGNPDRCRGLLRWIDALLGREPAQTRRLLAWLHLRRRAILTGQWRAGHALVLVGPPACGKSFLQSCVITPLLGGRIAKPYRYMSGGSDFNGDLAAAEHLAIEDDSTARDMDSRRKLGAIIKSMLFSRWQSIHPKNRQAVSLCPVWALSWSLNDEPENLQTLPPMEPSILDKLLLMRCQRARPHREPGDDGDDGEILQSLVQRELTALADYLDHLRIDDDLHEPRCGLLAYQHPSIMDALGAMSPESSLLDLIDDALFRHEPDAIDVPAPWRGQSSALERALREHDRHASDRILRFTSACGVLLARLMDQHPQRFSFTHVKGRKVWRIEPPAR